LKRVFESGTRMKEIAQKKESEQKQRRGKKCRGKREGERRGRQGF
jgi:hypothetical protein